jgi:protein SSD1
MRAIHDTESVTKIASNCNIKKDAAKLAQEQSSHLFLCVLIDDLTKRYGPVIRSSTVIGVLDSAFDIIIPEFGIEKRVHTDQMPLDVSLSYPLYTKDQSLMRLVDYRAMITMHPLIL